MEDRRTVEFGRMSWAEVAEIVPANPVLLLPIGTVEQHGPHMPVNADNMTAEYVALHAAPRTGAYVLPGIHYGCSAVFRKFPGTISVRQETLANVIRDVCGALLGQGFRRFIFVNNHGGNSAVCEQVARELKAVHGVVIGDIYPWNLGYGLMRETYEDAARVYGHGGEPETSAMLAMHPEDVLRERMPEGGYQPFAGWQPRSYSAVTVPGQPVPGTVYLDADEVLPHGVSGDPRVATTERGQLWVERVVAFATAFINHYDDVTRDADWAR